MNKYTHGGHEQFGATVHFYDSPGQVEWYWRFFKQGFQHVAVTIHHYTGDVHVDPRMPFVSVRRGTSKHDSTVVEVGVLKAHSDPPWAILVPGTCVSIVKACLGIRAWWVLTPHQLYKYLKKRGALLQ